MTGLIIALFFAAVNFLATADGLLSYQNVTGFLYGWYCWTTVVYVIVYLVWIVLMTSGLILVGGESGVLGAFLGFLGGAAVSGVMLIWLAISRGVLIFGASLLAQALLVDDGVAVWDSTKLLFGMIFIIIGILLGNINGSKT